MSGRGIKPASDIRLLIFYSCRLGCRLPRATAAFSWTGFWSLLEVDRFLPSLVLGLGVLDGKLHEPGPESCSTCVLESGLMGPWPGLQHVKDVEGKRQLKPLVNIDPKQFLDKHMHWQVIPAPSKRARVWTFLMTRRPCSFVGEVLANNPN